ncbi:MAG TPA: DNA polymerase, partial [Flavobacteriales bacterium]|nr:DNA polymerase [Flavobacteriales bacterium]
PELPPITEVANYPIQRTAGEMMNLEIIELDKRLTREVPDAKLVVQLHDAFDVECDEDDVDKVVAIYKEVCHREYTIEGRTRLFPVEIKTSRDWSDL